MSGYHFEPCPAANAADAWRPLDRAVHRWVRAHSEHVGTELLANVAAWASLADGEGDSALALADDNSRHAMPALGQGEIETLRQHPFVGTDANLDTAFVIDDANRFYLQRNHRNECSVAAALRARRNRTTGVDAITLEDDIDALFQGSASTHIDPQRLAVRNVGRHGVFVLTGGPGTGKTTTVLRMLLMLQRRCETALNIQVAAPTGKAAQRLVQALRNGKRQLLDEAKQALPAQWEAYLDRIPDNQAVTLHRLLGFEPWRNGFRHNAHRPISADVVVVDEASMIDLAMLRALLDAVRPDALLILVGDADQLTSIATGSVLMDLVTAMEASPNADDIVRLQQSFRAKPELVGINDAVRIGDCEALAHAVSSAGKDAVQRDVADAATLRDALHAWAQRLATSMRRATDNGCTAAAAFLALAQQQLLCALREGPFGAMQVNQILEQRLRLAWNQPNNTQWYPGRAVIVTHNDYVVGLFNGDLGICLAAADGTLRVWFEVSNVSLSSDSDAHTFRDFAPSTLPAHETAFAMTIHKSQGSEYHDVAVLLPPEHEHRILSRQLLYTALSRARRSIEIWSTKASVEHAVRTPVTRAGGLADRLLIID